jgi:hypothetical protein
VAVALFALIAVKTTQALRDSGAWTGALRSRQVKPAPRVEDPFSPLAALLGRPQPELPSTALRDPFMLGSAPSPIASSKPVVRKPVVPPAPARPLLTAIVWDNDPRAIVRWQGRDLTVRSGGLFDDFQVVDITRDHVTLNRGTETIVLQRKPQGD